MCANDQLGCNTNTALGVRMKMSAHRRRVPQQTQWRWTAAQTMQEAGGCHRGRLDEGAETDISEIVFLFYMAFSDWSPGFSIMASCCVPSIGTLFICSWFAWWNSTSRNTKFVPIPTWEKIIKNEHNVGFHSLQPLTGAFGRDINLNLHPFPMVLHFPVWAQNMSSVALFLWCYPMTHVSFPFEHFNLDRDVGNFKLLV